jgi:hypothetical protein
MVGYALIFPHKDCSDFELAGIGMSWRWERFHTIATFGNSIEVACLWRPEPPKLCGLKLIGDYADQKVPCEMRWSSFTEHRSPTHSEVFDSHLLKFRYLYADVRMHHDPALTE